MTDIPVNAKQLLEQANIALKYDDRQTARRLAQLAVSADPEMRDAWLLMAELSSGSARIAYLERAAHLSSGSSSKISNQALAKNVEIAVSQLPQVESPSSSKAGNASSNQEFPRSLQAINSKSPSWFLILTVLIMSGIILVALLAWMFLPTGQSVFAVDHSSYRQAGDLLKPTLTPTDTPEPTSTATATVTQMPTWTATPEPVLTDALQPIDQLPIPGIPENIIEGERWIDVDLTNQRTYAFEGSTLIRTFIVSTGTQYHPTITGQYHIYVKYRYTDMGGPGYYLPDVPYTMYFYQGYSLHGTYWHSNFGVPMSHGCINMITADAEWLYYWASIGTMVNIHY
jgi:lipoprotein-anchoring transpeptidase ErfK/SrfK